MNKFIMLIAIPLMFMSFENFEIGWHDEPTFNMCECTKMAQGFGYGLDESKVVCKDLLIAELMKRSEESGKIEDIIVIGCE